MHTPPALPSRADAESYARYFAEMDKTVRQKLALIGAHFLLKPGAVIADLGCGSGLGSYQLAQLNPHIQVIGVDLNETAIARAAELYKLPNLTFRVGDAVAPDFGGMQVDGILNSSLMHEVYSYNAYSMDHVERSFAAQMAVLKPGGCLVLRDFVAPEGERSVLLDLSVAPRMEGSADSLEAMSDADLLVRYAATARPLDTANAPGFFLEELPCPHDGQRRFRLPEKWAYEFALRKDYRHSWEDELREEYSYLSQSRFHELFDKLGARTLFSGPSWNPWIIENRFKGRLGLHDEAGRPLGMPPTNFFLVAQKVAPGESLGFRERRTLPASDSFLHISAMRDSRSGDVYDLAARPGAVYDLLPWHRSPEGRLIVHAKHGYPRPFVALQPRGTANLDRKRWSGHVVEPIAAGLPDSSAAREAVAAAVLRERAGLQPVSGGTAVGEGLVYYPSAGGVDERVQALPVEVQAPEAEGDIPAGLSGFSQSGTVRAFDAQDLLRAAQVGLLPEARLELNVYGLMRRQGVTPDPWIGAELQVPPAPPADAQAFGPARASGLEALLSRAPSQRFEPADAPAGFLRHVASLMEEYTAGDRGPRALASQKLEFVLPRDHGDKPISSNTLSVLPLMRGVDGEILVGLEERHLPAPQRHDGDSRHLCAPAWRLPTAVDSLDAAEGFVAAKLGDGAKLQRLGESYFASLGLSPERVYPYLATWPEGAKPPAELNFVPLKDVFQQMERLRDGHLLIAATRGVHALDLWKQYAPAPAPAIKRSLRGARPLPAPLNT